MRTLALLTALALAPLTDVVAQELPLQPGKRVRVTVPELGINKQEARFQAIEGETLVVTVDTTMRCPMASLERLDTYAGTRGHFWVGGGIGAVAGGVLGVLVAKNENFLFTHGVGECSSGDFCVADGVYVALGAAGGFLLGGIVGTMIRSDKWEEVPLDRLRVSIVPQRGGRLGFGVSIGF